MSRFKQAWLSFWRKNQGLGMIETALLLPIFLIFVFAVIDFGNYMIVKNRMVSAAQAVASAIQNNPTMSVDDLERVKVSSLGDLYKTGYAGYAIWTSKTPPTPETSSQKEHAVFVDGLIVGGNGNFWSQRNIKNPWLDDGDPSNDNKPYYVGVFLYKGVPYLTPLPKILPGITAAKGFGDDETSRAIGAPYGRKTAQVFTFVTLNNASCPADQVLQSMTGGAANCVPRDNNYACASGQTLEKIVDGKAVCVAKDNTCGPGQVLAGMKTDGTALCVDRDASFDCGANQVLQKSVNGTATCVDMDKAYTCSGNSVLQATSLGGAVCVDKDRGGQSCTGGQVVTGVTNGVVACGDAPKPSYSIKIDDRHNPIKRDFAKNDCDTENGYVQVGMTDSSDKLPEVWCARITIK
jgi:hypothetical protein